MAFTRPRLGFEKEPEQRLSFNWGDLTFDAQGVSLGGIRLAAAHNWARQSRLGQVETIQYVGSAAATLGLSGVILLGGLDAFDALRKAGGSVTPYALTDSSGRPWGRFALTRISADISQLMPSGELRAASWSMEFVESPDSEGVFRVDETVYGGVTNG